MAFALFFGIGGVLLLFRSMDNRYVIIEGVCTELEKTALRRKVKAAFIKTEDCMVKIIMKQRKNIVSVGDAVLVYVADNTPVYERDNCQLLCTYIALERKREEHRDAGTGVVRHN